MAVPERLAAEHVARRVVAALTEEERALCCLAMSFEEPAGPDELLLETAVLATRWGWGVPIWELKPTAEHMGAAAYPWPGFFLAASVFVKHGPTTNDAEWDDRVREIHRELKRSDLPLDRQERLERELDELVHVPLEKRAKPESLSLEEIWRLLKATAPDRYLPLR